MALGVVFPPFLILFIFSDDMNHEEKQFAWQFPQSFWFMLMHGTKLKLCRDTDSVKLVRITRVLLNLFF